MHDQKALLISHCLALCQSTNQPLKLVSCWVNGSFIWCLLLVAPSFNNFILLNISVIQGRESSSFCFGCKEQRYTSLQMCDLCLAPGCVWSLGITGPAVEIRHWEQSCFLLLTLTQAFPEICSQHQPFSVYQPPFLHNPVGFPKFMFPKLVSERYSLYTRKECRDASCMSSRKYLGGKWSTDTECYKCE